MIRGNLDLFPTQTKKMSQTSQQIQNDCDHACFQMLVAKVADVKQAENMIDLLIEKKIELENQIKKKIELENEKKMIEDEKKKYPPDTKGRLPNTTSDSAEVIYYAPTIGRVIFNLKKKTIFIDAYGLHKVDLQEFTKWSIPWKELTPIIRTGFVVHLSKNIDEFSSPNVIQWFKHHNCSFAS